MRVVDATRQEFRERDLWQQRAAEAERHLALRHLLPMDARRDPADPIARCQALRKRAAVDRVGAAIQRDEGLGTFAAEMDLAVDVVLDQRHAVPCEQGEQRPLVGFGHRRPERIAEARGDHAGGHGLGLEQARESLDVDAERRVGRHFQGLQSEHFDRVQQSEIGRRLDRDRVSAPGHRGQGQHQCLGASVGDEDIVGRQRVPESHCALGDLAAQARIATRRAVDVVVRAVLARGPRERQVEPLRLQQRCFRHGAAERHER